MKFFGILSFSLLLLAACQPKIAKVGQTNKVLDSLFLHYDHNDSFDKSSPGKIPDGWFSTITGKNTPGHWEVVENKDGKSVGQTSSQGSGYLFNLLILKEPELADLALSVKIKAIGGKEDQGGGLVWRYQNSDNYYLARANPLENNFRVYKVIDGNRKQLKSYELPVSANIWHNITIIHRLNTIQCFYDSQLFLVTKDSSINNAGKIGLWTKADAQTLFNDLKVLNFRKVN
jgi:hypothetical protein